MNRKLVLSLAGAAAAVFMAVGTAQAAPPTSSLDTLKTLGQQQSNIEQIRRRCRWRCHHRWSTRRVCRRVCRWW